MKKPFLTGLFLAVSIAVQAQVSPQKDTLRISLSGIWEKAETHSREIDIRKQTVNMRDEEVKDDHNERLPELGVYGSAEKASNIPIYENGLFSAPTQHEVIHTLYRMGTDMYLNIYNGNKLNLKIEADKTLADIARIRQEQTTSDIRYQSAALYLTLQKSLVFRDLMLKDIADQEKQLIEIKSFHKNGVVLKSDVLRVELDLSRRKMTLVTIENDILIAQQKLNIIIGEPDERIILPVDSLIESETLQPYENCLTQAMQHAFNYQISKQQTELSAIHVRQIRANVRPKVGMYGDFYYANPQIFLYPYNPYWYSLGVAGVKASFPISSLYHNVHKLKAAQIELATEETKHKDTEDKVRQQVKEAYLRYQEALVQIDVAKVNINHAEENARIIKNTYFSQTSLITDLLDADVQLLQTRFELAAAKISAQTKYYLLQNITGTL
ncbi:TolC family protein [Taibaiella soli]|uniref:TolC family protein n=1 Tax=Taibaiella soli TaxID=1649169 RepID=A0A2W2AMH3_9BACT|nr:TolC family protein [Taibaiella soli]PZF74732.1 TolC family protein [Taibaiella soli]